MFLLPTRSFLSVVHNHNRCDTKESHSEGGTGRCFVCLKRNHLSHDCRSLIKCVRCNGRNHASVCKEGHINSNPTRGGTRSHHVHVNRTKNYHLHGTRSHQVHRVTHQQQHSCIVNTAVTVLLQTAKAYVHKLGDPGCGITIRIMLDGGVRGPM